MIRGLEILTSVRILGSCNSKPRTYKNEFSIISFSILFNLVYSLAKIQFRFFILKKNKNKFNVSLEVKVLTDFL